MGKVPLQVLKELEHQARLLSLPSSSQLLSQGLLPVCNTNLEKCRHSLKATFKKVKSQIQKGANPERAARRGYDDACEYLDIMNKRILIQQRAYSLPKQICSTYPPEGIVYYEAEMTLL